jgi:hypothetical protein
MDLLGPNEVIPTCVKHMWLRILQSSNTTKILNGLCSELETEVDLASESENEFELLRQQHSDYDARIHCSQL